MNEPKALPTVDEFCRVTSVLIDAVDEELANKVAAALASAQAADDSGLLETAYRSGINDATARLCGVTATERALDTIIDAMEMPWVPGDAARAAQSNGDSHGGD